MSFLPSTWTKWFPNRIHLNKVISKQNSLEQSDFQTEFTWTKWFPDRVWTNLSTTFVLVKHDQPSNGLDDVRLFVHYNDSCRSKAGLNSDQSIEVHDSFVTDMFWDHRGRWSTRNDAQQVIPSSNHIPSMSLNQFLQRNGHFFLNCAWIVDMAWDVEQLSPTIPVSSKGWKPLCSPPQNTWSDGNGFNIVDCRRTSKDSNISRKWRLESWFSLFPFDWFNERRFLATNIGTSTSMDEDVEVVSRSTCILSNESSFVSFLDGDLEVTGFVVELSSDVNICCSSTHGSSSDQTTFDQLVGIMSHDLPILACSRLTFVGIHNQVLRPSIRGFSHETPLESWRKSGSTSSPKTWILHFLDDPICSFQEYFLRFVPITLDGSENQSQSRNANQYSAIWRSVCGWIYAYPCHGSFEPPIMPSI